MALSIVQRVIIELENNTISALVLVKNTSNFTYNRLFHIKKITSFPLEILWFYLRKYTSFR